MQVAAAVVVVIAVGCATKTVRDTRPDFPDLANAIAFEPLTAAPEASGRANGNAFPSLQPYPSSDEPMFDDGVKTAGMRAADAAFLSQAEQRGFATAAGSDLAVENGWQAFAKNDYAGAVRQFNEAWLLDPENGNAYDGFATVVAVRERDAFRAENFFKGGIAKRHSASILLHYAVFLIKTNRPADAVAPLGEALGHPEAEGSARALLVVALAGTGDMAAACAEAAKVTNDAVKNWRDVARSFDRRACAADQ